MSLLGGSSSNSLLGGSKGSGGGGGGPVIKQLRQTILFRKDETEIANNINVKGDVNFDGNLVQDGKDALFDLQHLFEYLTKPAPAFEKNNDIIDPVEKISAVRILSFQVTFYWIRGKDYDTTYNFSLEDKELPYIERIGIDVKDASGILQEWVKADDIPSDSSKYTFKVDRKFTDSSDNETTIDKEKGFSLRIYPINSSGYDNYLIFNDLFFGAASTPTNPRNLSVTVNSGIPQKSFILNFEKPLYNEFDEIMEDEVLETVKTEPPIVGYKIQYQPIEGDVSNVRFPGLLDTSLVSVERDGNNSTTTYTVTNSDSSPVYPGTVYDISLSARNEQNALFGDISSISHVTDLPLSSDFVDTDISNIQFSGQDNKNIYHTVSDNLSNVNYFNIYDSRYDTLKVSGTNKIFVNYTRLGKAANQKGKEPLERLAKSTISYSNQFMDEVYIEFYGYTTEETDGCFNNIPGNDVSFVEVKNTDATQYGDNHPEYKGFGLMGEYQISIKDDLINRIFEPSNILYFIKYKNEGISIDKNGGTNNNTVNYEFYVDDLSGDPTIDHSNIELGDNQLIYNHGIPSIKSFRISVDWKVTNNGRYFLPTDGKVSFIQINNNNISTTGSETGNEEYNERSIEDEYNLNYTQNIHFTDAYINKDDVSDALKISSFNILNTVTDDVDINTVGVGDNVLLYCDYDSFKKNNGIINAITDFGENIYQYDPTKKYSPDVYYQQNSIRDNQLIFFDGVFVGPGYVRNDNFSPYSKFNVYDYSNENGFTTVDYSSKAESGDDIVINDETEKVKWLVKYIPNVTSTTSNPLKKLIITDSTGDNSDYGRYKNRLFILQVEKGTKFQTGWLDLNELFDDTKKFILTDKDFIDRGVNIASSENFVLFGKDNAIFDIYIRIGILNNENNFISSLELQQV